MLILLEWIDALVNLLCNQYAVIYCLPDVIFTGYMDDESGSPDFCPLIRFHKYKQYLRINII